MTAEPTPFDVLATEVERVAEHVDGMRGNSGGTFWVDLYGPVPVETRGLPACAAAVYGRITRVLDVRPVPVKSWRRRLRTSFRQRAGFGGQQPDRTLRDIVFQADWLCELAEEALGPVGTAGIVTHEPKSWYAALWEDWLLVGEEWAVVLSLTNDS